jgi:polyisoprenoid-binding protein YceI
MTNLKALPRILLITAGTLRAETAIVQLRSGVASRMELTVEKTGLLSGRKHLSTFSEYRGTLQFDRETPEASTVEFTIEAGTIMCRDTWLNPKDLGKVQQYALKEMLAAEKHPQISFRSTGARKLDATRYRIEGVLTIRDVARPVIVAASLNSGPANEVSIEGTAVVRLTDFGLKPPSTALGAIGTRDEMALRFVLPATLP